MHALGFICLFVCLYSDVSITAAYYCHLADLLGASAAATFAVLASASASASAHRNSPSRVDNNRITLHPKELVLKRHWLQQDPQTAREEPFTEEEAERRDGGPASLAGSPGPQSIPPIRKKTLHLHGTMKIRNSFCNHAYLCATPR
jgi:hypothetical protein